MVKEQKDSLSKEDVPGKDDAEVRASSACTQEKAKIAAEALEEVTVFFDAELLDSNLNIFWNLFVVNRHLAVDFLILFVKMRVRKEKVKRGDGGGF
jgi:hypothetical protein